MCIGALVYWAVGFGLTFGNSPPLLAPFMGSSYFFFFNMPGKSDLTLHEPHSNRFQRIQLLYDIVESLQIYYDTAQKVYSKQYIS